MATYTQFYNLDKYEGTDRPNLRDQYNAAMDKIDSQLHTQAGNIASAATAAQTAAQAAATADSKATTAAADASTADSKATSAQATASTADSKATTAGTNAAQALSQLNGLHMYYIHNDSKGTNWNPGAWANNTCVFNACILFDEDTQHGMLYGYFLASSNSATPTTAWAIYDILTLTDWKADANEGYNGETRVTVVQYDWADAIVLTKLVNDRVIIQTAATQPGSTNPLQANANVTAVVAFPVVKKTS